jgi:hypothetical protein
MILKDISAMLEAEKICVEDLFFKEITMVCASDLMSDVLAFIRKSETLLLTGLVNPQVIRTAEFAEIVAICFVRGKKPPLGTVTLAKEKNIPLLATKLSMFDACGRLYAEGLRGCGSIQ